VKNFRENQTAMGKKGKKFWGPIFWDHLMVCAATYTPDKRDAVEIYVTKVLPVILPCQDPCARNLLKHLKKLPIKKYLGDKTSLFLWCYILHDLVNQEITAENPEDPRTSPEYVKTKANWFSSVEEDCPGCQT